MAHRLVAVLCFVFVLCFGAKAQGDKFEKRVWVVFSYEENFPTYDFIRDALYAYFDSANISFDALYMDSKQFNDSLFIQHFDRRMALIKKRYSNRRYDAVITVDDNALDYCLKNHNRIFDKKPIFFLGVNDAEKALSFEANPDVTGVVERISFSKTISVMKQLDPQLKEVYAIYDETNTAHVDLRQFRIQKQKFPGIEFQLLNTNNINLNEFRTWLKTRKDHSAGLLISAFHYKDGSFLPFRNALNVIKKNSVVPVYHNYYHGFGDGITGGALVNYREHAQVLSKMLDDYLNGKTVQEISVQDSIPNKAYCDYAQVKRFGLDVGNIPEDYIVKNEPQYSFEVERPMLIAVTVALFSLLVALFFSHKQSIARKKMTAQLIKAKEVAEESNALKTAFLSNMSHEIRTPMNAIMGFSQILRQTEGLNEQQSEYIQIIMAHSHQLLHVINDILEISKIDTGQMSIIKEKFEIGGLLKDVMAAFHIIAETKGLDFNIVLRDASSICIETDRQKLQHILNNLISNAIKFTKKGSVEVGCVKNYDKIIFWVKDTGIGISEEHKEKIFDRFTQAEIDHAREFGGTGLGLSISKSLVEMLGGRIWVESERNKGSQFFFDLALDDAEKVDKFASKGSFDLSEATVLIAEDEHANFLLLKELFEFKNATVLYAADGMEAVTIFKKNRMIDLVLLDIKMPKMDGRAAKQRIKQLSPSVPIIAQTAFAQNYEEQELLNEGFDGYIRKPISAQKLFAEVQRVMGQGKTQVQP